MSLFLLYNSVCDELITSSHLQLIQWKDAAGNVQEFRLYNVLASCWKRMADGIGFDIHETELIECDCDRYGAEECTRKVINRWVKDAYSYKIYPTWNELCKLLNNIEHSNASEKLKEALEADQSTFQGNLSTSGSDSTSESDSISEGDC